MHNSLNKSMEKSLARVEEQRGGGQRRREARNKLLPRAFTQESLHKAPKDARARDVNPAAFVQDFPDL